MCLAISLAFVTAVSGRQNRSPQLVAQNGHFDTITAMTYSNDESSLLQRVGTEALSYGQLRVVFYCEPSTDGSVHTVAISRDGQLDAAADQNKVSFWEIETGTLARTVELKAKGYYYNSFVSPSPDWKHPAPCNREAINLWDVSSGTLINTFKTSGSAGVAAFSDLISAGVDFDNMVRFGNADSFSSCNVVGPEIPESGTSALFGRPRLRSLKY